MGAGRGDVRDDVWEAAVLQQESRRPVWADFGGGDQVPKDVVWTRQTPAGWIVEKETISQVGYLIQLLFV